MKNYLSALPLVAMLLISLGAGFIATGADDAQPIKVLPAKELVPNIDMLSGVPWAFHTGKVPVGPKGDQAEGTLSPSTSPATSFGTNIKADTDPSVRPQNEPSIAADESTSILVAGANDYRAGPPQCHAYRSTNAGVTWSSQALPGTIGVFAFSGDPSLAYDSLNNIAYYECEDFGNTDIYVYSSTDAGMTWTKNLAVLNPFGAFDDKPWIAVDDSPDSDFKGNVYLCYTEFSGGATIKFARSTDNAATWSAPIAASPTRTGNAFVQVCQVATAPDGTVYVAYWDQPNFFSPPGSVMINRSDDGGASFTGPMLVANANYLFNRGIFPTLFRSGPSISLSVGPEGNAYAAFADAQSTVPRPNPCTGDIIFNDQSRILFTRSTNKGVSWSSPFAVDDDPGMNDKFFPAVTTQRDGAVHVFWNDRRPDITNPDRDYDAFYAASIDGGVSFGPNVRVSTVSSNPFNDGFGGCFIGDYVHMADTCTDVHPVWTDTRQVVTTGDIFTARGQAFDSGCLFNAKGQRADVNSFLSYYKPGSTRTKLPSGITSFEIALRYGSTTIPDTFSATLNGVDVTGSFNHTPGTSERVNLPLSAGRNVIVLHVDGVRSDGATATETDRLAFLVG